MIVCITSFWRWDLHLLSKHTESFQVISKRSFLAGFALLWFLRLQMKVDQCETNSETGPHRESFPGGTEIDAGPPKLSEELTDHFEKVFTQIWSDFLPKIKWRAKKKKKGLHSNSVQFFAQNFRFFAQNRVKSNKKKEKRSSLKLGPIFCPKLGKRSSIKLGPIF